MSLILSGSDGVSDIDGSASTPAIRGTDANTGIFFPAADTIAFAEGGAEAMRINSSAQVLVGTTTARGVAASGSAVFEIEAVNAITASLVNNNNSSGSSALLMFGKSRGGAVGGTTVVQNGDELGEIRFAGADGTNLQSYAASIRTEVDGTPGSGDMPGRLIFSTTADGAGSSTERARITSGGEVYIAGTTDQGAYNLQCNGTGVWGAGAYVNGSDSRIKEDIASIASGLDVVEKLNPVTYRYKEDWSKDQSTQTGFIAQELLVAMEGKNYVDGVVQQGGLEGYYSVAYQNIIPILTKAIQELKAINDAQATRIETLEAQNAAFETRLAALENK